MFRAWLLETRHAAQQQRERDHGPAAADYNGNGGFDPPAADEIAQTRRDLAVAARAAK